MENIVMNKDNATLQELTMDEQYMMRCIQLARKGGYGAAPNPMVGAVVVCDGRIIGEGYHRRCGGPHAEVNAIASVKDEGLLSRSTIYVSLEPCAHYGKTPPCAQLIIDKRISRVVVGCADPFPRVDGRGVHMLRDAGVEVKVGVLEKECRDLNKKFITYFASERPYITLKWACSADGFVNAGQARNVEGKEQNRVVFSSPVSQLRVHKQRSMHQAIMVGSVTAEVDDPSLNNRCWVGATPLRVVLDGEGRLVSDLRVFSDGGDTLVFIYNDTPVPDYVQFQNVQVQRVDRNEPVLPQIMQKLYGLGIQSLLVEGGPTLLNTFIESQCWDEAWVEQSAIVLGEGVRAPHMPQGMIHIHEADGNELFHICPFSSTQMA